LERIVNDVNERGEMVGDSDGFVQSSGVYTGKDNATNIERFPSGSLSLDIALGGGLPAGRVVTGGGALTCGLERIAKNVLKMPVRVGKPTGVTGLIDEIQEQIEELRKDKRP